MKCKFGFYTCEFKGNPEFCADCEDGCNYQEQYKYQMNNVWHYIKADSFFRDYLPNIKSYKHKIRGKNGRGNPTEFSPQELQEIKKALRQLFRDISG